MPSPRELWLEERCKYLEECIESLGFKTDPESFYAHRGELQVKELSPYVYTSTASIQVPWAVRVEAERDLRRFGWEIKVRTTKTGTSDYAGLSMHVTPPPSEGDLIRYAQLLLEDMMQQLVTHYWGRPTK